MNSDMFRVQLTNAAGSSLTEAPRGPSRCPETTFQRARRAARGSRTSPSAHSYVGTGAEAVTVGFYISGSGSKQLLIRGVGLDPRLLQHQRRDGEPRS